MATQPSLLFSKLFGRKSQSQATLDPWVSEPWAAVLKGVDQQADSSAAAPAKLRRACSSSLLKVKDQDTHALKRLGSGLAHAVAALLPSQGGSGNREISSPHCSFTGSTTANGILEHIANPSRRTNSVSSFLASNASEHMCEQTSNTAQWMSHASCDAAVGSTAADTTWALHRSQSLHCLRGQLPAGRSSNSCSNLQKSLAPLPLGEGAAAVSLPSAQHPSQGDPLTQRPPSPLDDSSAHSSQTSRPNTVSSISSIAPAAKPSAKSSHTRPITSYGMRIQPGPGSSGGLATHQSRPPSSDCEVVPSHPVQVVHVRPSSTVSTTSSRRTSTGQSSQPSTQSSPRVNFAPSSNELLPPPTSMPSAPFNVSQHRRSRDTTQPQDPSHDCGSMPGTGHSRNAPGYGAVAQSATPFTTVSVPSPPPGPCLSPSIVAPPGPSSSRPLAVSQRLSRSLSRLNASHSADLLSDLQTSSSSLDARCSTATSTATAMAGYARESYPRQLPDGATPAGDLPVRAISELIYGSSNTFSTRQLDYLSGLLPACADRDLPDTLSASAIAHAATAVLAARAAAGGSSRRPQAPNQLAVPFALAAWSPHMRPGTCPGPSPPSTDTGMIDHNISGNGTRSFTCGSSMPGAVPWHEDDKGIAAELTSSEATPQLQADRSGMPDVSMVAGAPQCMAGAVQLPAAPSSVSPRAAMLAARRASISPCTSGVTAASCSAHEGASVLATGGTYPCSTGSSDAAAAAVQRHL